MSSTRTDSVNPTRSYPHFLWWGLGEATNGGILFYVWMFVLTAISLVGANAWANQVAQGMIVTGMTDHVSWGLYIANFTFCVGLAAGGVMMVIPAYLYDDEEMHKVVIIGEAVATFRSLNPSSVVWFGGLHAFAQAKAGLRQEAARTLELARALEG